ncbi:MAG TPA: CAP domain-containing protein [Bacillota bacterium]|nr:CAP domain-containing protein [Bacillota bacterium]
MKNKKISVTLFAALLLVVSAASTAFAGTVTANSGCGTLINGQEEYAAEGRPMTAINENIVVKVIVNPQDQGNVVFQEPMAGQPQQPAEQPEIPVAEEPEAPVAKEPGIPVVEEPEVPVVEEPEVPVMEEPEAPQAEEPMVPADQNLSGLNAQEREMVEYVNQERAKAGRAQLQVDLDLARVARIKSQDMVDNGYFDHNSPTYGSPFEMMRSFGISYRAAGENIAKNRSVIGAHTALMNSEGHRANILNPNFTHMGIGIVENGGMVTVTQMFIAK